MRKQTLDKALVAVLVLWIICGLSLAAAAWQGDATEADQPNQQKKSGMTETKTQTTKKEEPPKGGEPKPFTLPQPQRFSLPNGIEVTMVPYGRVPKVTMTVVVRAGGIDEGPQQVWLGDLTGDLMKEGTKTLSAEQVAEKAASMGGAINIGVGADETTIASDVLSEFGPQAAALLADVVTSPKLPESEWERLKKDRQRQLSIEMAQPRSLALERFRQTLYPNHPYGRVFPTPEMLASYTVEDARQFYQKNFGAARTRIYVAGVFDAAAMKKAITASFGDWEKGSAAESNVPKAVKKGTLEVIDRPGAQQSTLYIGLPVVDPSNPDYVPLQVTNALLGGSFMSRITSNIREDKGYTYSPFGSISSRYRDAYWVEVADVTTGVTGPSLKEIFYEIDRLRKEAPAEKELAGIENYMAGIFVLQNSSRGGVIAQLRFVDLHGLGDTYLENYVQRVRAVTPEQIQAMAKKYLEPKNMAIVVVGDTKQIAEQVKPYAPQGD